MNTQMLSVELLILMIGVFLFEFFNHVDCIWGPHSVDRFANSHSRKLPRFLSQYWNPDSKGVDAFCYDW